MAERMYVLTGVAALTSAMCLTASAQDLNRLTPAEKAAGWQLLFDGATLNGWEDPSQKHPPGDAWTLEDGSLKARAHPRIREDLISARHFGDFELTFDWRISPGGNSGLKYRIQKTVFVRDRPAGEGKFEDLVEMALRGRRNERVAPGQDYVIAFEYQVIDDARNPDAARGGIQQAGALYDLVAPSGHPARPAREFNHSRILLRGNHVEHWMNGIKIVETDLSSAAIADGLAKRWGRGSAVYELLTHQPQKVCPISLQNHGDDAWFRNLKIRPLGP